MSLQREDIANGEAIGKWLFEDLRKLYGEMGYIEYTAEPEPEFRVVDHAANEGLVDFKVTIEEGRQFRIRSIRFDGSNISEKELHTLLLIRPGDVFNQQLLEKSVNQLNATEWFEMIDKDQDTDFKTDEEEALLDITLRLKRVKRRWKELTHEPLYRDQVEWVSHADQKMRNNDPRNDTKRHQ